MSRKYVVGVDLGGTKIATGLGNMEGDLLAVRIIPTQASLGVDGVIERIYSTIYDVLEEAGADIDELYGIGICSPGPVNPKTGMIALAPNLGWENVPLVQLIAKEFPVPVFLENDANAAALGELWFGAGRGVENLLYITVSTGIGGGIVLGGKIYRGRNFMAGEIGHAIFDANSPVQCGCGQYGCIETLASGTAIARIARERIQSGEESMIRSMVDNLDEVDVRIIAQAEEKGDKLAKDVLDNAVRNLGLFIASLLNILDVDRVIIGGGVSKLGSRLFDGINDVIVKNMADIPAKNTPIVPSQTGDNVGILGAIGLVFESIGYSRVG